MPAMDRRGALIAVVVAAATTAHAAPQKQPEKTPADLVIAALDDSMNWGTDATATFAFDWDKTAPLDATTMAHVSMGDVELVNATVGFASSGTEAFVSGEIREFGDCGSGGRNCGVTLGWLHGAFLVEKSPFGWRPTVWNRSNLDNPAPADTADLPRKLGGADDAVKLFESTLGDPKAFAKTVSDRKDAVLLGSAKGERFVGGAKIRAKLAAWNLALQVRGGIQAGLSQNNSFAWVAANVDARPAKGAKDKPPAPYRLLAIYEKTAGGWKLVSVSFSD